MLYENSMFVQQFVAGLATQIGVAHHDRNNVSGGFLKWQALLPQPRLECVYITMEGYSKMHVLPDMSNTH